MGSSELKSLLLKLGIKSESAKKRFCELFDAVFHPFGGYGSSPPPETAHPAAVATFRTVIRKHIRCSPTVYLSTQELQTAFEEAEIESRASWDYSFAVYQQMQEEQCWIKSVNEWRRDQFLKANLEETVTQFRAQFWRNYYSLDRMAFHEEQQFQNAINLQVARAEGEFCKKLLQEEQAAGGECEWRDQLRQKLSQVAVEVLEKNRWNKQLWNDTFSLAENQYENLMSGFLNKHPFANTEKVERAHVESKSKVEEEHSLVQILNDDPVMKSLWDARINQKHINLVENWKNSFKLDGDGLDALSSEDFEEVARRLFEKGEWIEVGPGDLDNAPEVAQPPLLHISHERRMSEASPKVINKQFQEGSGSKAVPLVALTFTSKPTKRSKKWKRKQKQRTAAAAQSTQSNCQAGRWWLS